MIKKDSRYTYVFFVGRLEKEKGADILLEVIRESIQRGLPYRFCIFWSGSYFSYLSEFENKGVYCFGHVDSATILSAWQYADVLFMPSRFLETFGLVALEALTQGIPVIWFRQGWLTAFIQKEHALSFSDPVGDFFSVIQRLDIPPVDVNEYTYNKWRTRLSEVIGHHKRILVVHDYAQNIGGAEVYVQALCAELQSLWCDVRMYAYKKTLTSWWKRKVLFLGSIFSFWRYLWLRAQIRTFVPDTIFSHSLMRYVGIWGVLAIRESGVTHSMMHHDLGLIAPRPSQLYSESDIPYGLQYASWIRKERWNILRILMTTGKYLWVYMFWKVLPKHTRHFLPAEWMRPYFIRVAKEVQVFPHTSFPSPSKRSSF